MKNCLRPGGSPARVFRREAEAIAWEQDLRMAPCGWVTMKIGTARIRLRHVDFHESRHDGLHSYYCAAPPELGVVLDSGRMSEGTLEELRMRLAIILAIDAITVAGADFNHGDDLHAVLAAMDFAKLQHRCFREVDPHVAEIDYLTWRGHGRDLSAWFDVRFVRSRLFAV
jgi:hypothetical protein